MAIDAIEIVSFPINSLVIFHSYVSLPEGNMIVFVFNVSFVTCPCLFWLNVSHVKPVLVLVPSVK
jgi:hypothetical protein